MSQFKGGYFRGPNDAFEIGLNAYQIAVYLYLTRRNNNSEAFPGYNDIAKKAGMSRSKAIQVVEELERMNLIKKEVRRSQSKYQSNIYTINDPHEVKSSLLEVVKLTPQAPEFGGAPSAPHGLPSAPHALPSAQDGLYKELDYKDPLYEEQERKYIALPSDAHSFINIYEYHFQMHMQTDHMRVTKEQSDFIISNMEKLVDYDISEEEFEEAVVEHFETLPESNNGNIIAFIYTFHRRFSVNNTVQAWWET